MPQDMGASAEPTGLPPASRAEPVVSGKAGIPCAGFTPGPWEVRGIRARFATVTQVDALGRPSRHVAEMAWDNQDEYAPQDARLISAAPDLYEAVAEFCERVERGEIRSVKTYNKFKAVLAKARGGSDV